MERIKEAIDKSRGQRESIAKSYRSAYATSPEHTPKRQGAEHRAGVDAEFQYRQTPVFSLDMAHLESQRIVAHQKSHPASWAFDLLRTQVLQKMDQNGWKTVAVTSPTMESGKTVVSVNLAIAIAQQTNRTSLLIDFDLRRPKVATALGLRPETSLNQVLTGSASVEDALVNPGLPRFVVLPTRHSMTGSAEVLGSTRVASLMAELRDRYDDRVVVIDLPPVLAADDVLAITPRVDCVLMVVGNGSSTRKEIEEAMSRLSKVPLLGVILNKDEAPSSNAYY